MVSTDQAGFQLSGWKSVMLRQILQPVWNRPLGVTIVTMGGAMGYSGGKMAARGRTHRSTAYLPAASAARSATRGRAIQMAELRSVGSVTSAGSQVLAADGALPRRRLARQMP
eukprot:CAMPEP_0197937464 /NCGR_PEP_ID=MMETSP1439-20131203/116529_1 /TAXON_ID=66791 /ORGANISM="Gonyaulax spinifera, Strain CCMP409" /LENGTH=112 /DNA_ID=CAMNT_0043560491 /DNA_START=238 /DNA_END=573 /DNA_ORIENTATION=-